jgi:hypothetical protein
LTGAGFCPNPIAAEVKIISKTNFFINFVLSSVRIYRLARCFTQVHAVSSDLHAVSRKFTVFRASLRVFRLSSRCFEHLYACFGQVHDVLGISTNVSHKFTLFRAITYVLFTAKIRFAAMPPDVPRRPISDKLLRLRLALRRRNEAQPQEKRKPMCGKAQPFPHIGGHSPKKQILCNINYQLKRGINKHQTNYSNPFSAL